MRRPILALLALAISILALGHFGSQASRNNGVANAVVPAPPAPLPAPTCVSAPPGMISWWAGEGNAGDMRGANNATPQNVVYAPGKVGNGFVLNGTDAFIDVADNSSINPNQLTIDAWINVNPAADPAGYYGVMTKYFSVDNWRQYEMFINNQKLVFRASETHQAHQCSITSTNNITFGQWTHVAATVDPSACNLYINGNLEANAPGLNNIQAVTVNLEIGVGGSVQLGLGGFFPGMIDEVEIFGRALSQTEIQSIYSASTAGKCPPSMLQFSSAAYTVAENDASGHATITVTRTGATDTIASVNFAACTCGTASAGAGDFTAVSGTLYFAVGENSKTFQVPITNDSLYEPDETVSLELSSPSGTSVSLGSPSSSVLTIQSEDLQADLAISAFDSPDPVIEGNALTYSINVTNNGPDMASIVTVTDALPANVIFLSASPGCSYSSGTVTCSIINLPSGGATANRQITVMPSHAAAGSVISNTVTATGAEYDPTANSWTETTQVLAATCVTPPTSMVGWWPGQNNANDISGHGNNGTRQNGDTYATGKVGEAFNFDGVDDYVSIPNIVNGWPEGTIDTWVNFKDPTPKDSGDYIFSSGGTILGIHKAAGNDFVFGIYDAVLGWQWAHSNIVPKAGQWYHLTGTWGPAGINLYVDGVWVGTDPYTGPSYNSTYNSIGAAANINGSTVNAYVDEFAIFTRALSQTEIQSIYNASVAGKCQLSCTTPPSGMIHWWPGQNNANDVIGTNNGTINGATFAAGEVGQALNLSAANQYVDVGDLDLPTAFTIDAWVKPSDLSNGPFILSRDDGVNPSYFFRIEPPGSLILLVRNVGGSLTIYRTTSPVVSTGVWQHVAATYDGDQVAGQRIKFTVNGVNASAGIMDTNDAGGAPENNSLSARIGTFADVVHYPFLGLLDEVEIYNRALSQAEIQSIYNANYAGKCHTSSIQFESATYNVAENEGSGNATVTVTRSGVHDTAATVAYATIAGGTATSGADCTGSADYRTTTGTLNFAAGEVSKTFTVPICDDNVYEGGETVRMQLANVTGTGVTLGSQVNADLTIQDNERVPYAETAITGVRQPEGSSGGTTNFDFIITLTHPSAYSAVIAYSTSDITASQLDDYTAIPSGTLTIPPGSTSGTITVAVNADTTFEPDEAFFLNLNGASGCNLVYSQVAGTIQNDDGQPTISINDVSATEGDSGTKNFTLNVTLSNPSYQTINVDYATADGTATAPSDYSALTLTTLTFNPGETSKPVNVAVKGDTSPEANETFSVELSNAVNGTINDSQGAGTITNDDTCVTSFTLTSNGDEDDPAPGDGVCGSGGICTLRAAITETNALPACGTIDIRIGATPIQVLTPLPAIAHNINIIALLPATVLRLSAADFRIFTINSGATVSMTGLTISNGHSIEPGGGIHNSGSLTLNNCTISDNFAPNGGGILNAGTLTIDKSTLSGNSAIDGGGLYNYSGAVTITNSTISGNAAWNWGGGLNQIGMADSSLLLKNCTISNNRADSDNEGTGTGGGISQSVGTVTLQSTIVAANFNDASPSTTPDDIVERVGFMTIDPASSYNLIGNGGSGGLTDSVNHNQVGISNPLLGPLQDNGGPPVGSTFTQALLCGSPAIDKGTNNGTVSDQRMLPRMFDDPSVPNAGTDATDIGAFELQETCNLAPTDFLLNNTSLDENQPAGTVVGDFTAVDPDAGDTHTYYLVSGPGDTDNGFFSTTGYHLSTASVLDFETKSTYSIRLRCRDQGHLYVDKVFTITVNNVNEAPTISDVPDQLTNENTPTSAIPVLLGDPDGNPESLTLSGVSSNTTLVPDAGIVVAGSGTSRTVTVTPVPNQVGTSTITLSVSDGNLSSSDSFLLTVGTPTSVNPGDVIISEFRLRGPGMALTQTSTSMKSGASGAITQPATADNRVVSSAENDEFIELYNNTDQAITVSTTDGSAGWAVVASDGLARFIVPNGTVIPARGHFLGVNIVGYSLSLLASGDQVLLPSDLLNPANGYALDIPDNSGLAVFRTANPNNFILSERLDAVGPTEETKAIYREGAGYPALDVAVLAANLEHSFFRKQCGFVQGVGCQTPGRPKDTDDNAADFIFVDTQGTNTPAGQRLGMPGPENLGSPFKRDPQINVPLLDATAGEASEPNRGRNHSADIANNSTFGTLTVRRRVVNETGQTVRRLRFRIVEFSTFPSPVGWADLRALTSDQVSITNINDVVTCGKDPTPCVVTVRGTTLEMAKRQPGGGGLNSILTVELLEGGLPNGESINVQFLLGVQQTGLFRFLVIIEALP